MAICFIEAAMESTRLPGKPMLEIAGESMIHWALTHAAKSPSIDRIYVFVPGSIADQPLIDCLHAHPTNPIPILSPLRAKGDLNAELRHFLMIYPPVSRCLIRLTADNPLLGPDIIERAIKAFDRTSADIVSTRHDWLSPPSCYPPGYDVEVIRTEFAERTLWSIPASSWTKDECKFTSLFAYRRGKVKWVLPSLPPPPGLSLTVDTEVDLARVRTVMVELGPHPSYETVMIWHQRSLSAPTV